MGLDAEITAILSDREESPSPRKASQMTTIAAESSRKTINTKHVETRIKSLEVSDLIKISH